MAWTTLTIAYFTVAAVAAVIVFVVSDRLGDERRPIFERLGLSAAAGLVWPVILLGVAEVSSFAAYAKVHEHDDDLDRVEVLV